MGPICVRGRGEPKDPHSAHLFQIYGAFANSAERADFATELRAGLGWGAAKAKVHEHIDAQLREPRERYLELIAHPERIEQTLQAGAERVRKIGRERLDRVRHAVGLRPLTAVAEATTGKQGKQKPPRLVSYSEDGRFNFKFVAPDGVLLAAGDGFDSPALAGAFSRNFETIWTRADNREAAR